MNYSLKKIFFSIAVAVSIAVITSPSYAKDEGDKKPKTTKIKKAKKDESKKSKSAKSDDSKSKDNKATGKSTDTKDKGSDKAGKSTDTKGKDNDKASKSTDTKGKDNDKAGKSTDTKGKGSDKAGKSTDTKDKDDKADKDNKSGKSNNSKGKDVKKKTATKTSNTKKQYKNIIVNLNKADEKTFSHYLMGIGETRAKAIIAYRKKNGNFKNIKALLKVDGIGEKIFAGLEKNVSLTKGEVTPPKTDTKKAKK